MQKPDLNQVLKIIRLKEEASRLYGEADKLTVELMNEYGENTFYYNVENIDGQKEPYLKVQLVDNIKKLATEGHVWTSASVKQFSCVSTGLKRKPESLK